MTEFSSLWTTGGAGDGASTYNRDAWDDIIHLLSGGLDFATQGVIGGYLNDLAVSNPAGKTVRVASGGGIVDGKLYRNTADVDLTPTTPVVGTTGIRVVLRKSWSAQTVRIALLEAADGTSTPPAVTQSDGVTWEISLATGEITTGDSVTLTDARAVVAMNGSPSPASLVAIGEISDAGVLSNEIGISSVNVASTGTFDVTFSQEVVHVFGIAYSHSGGGADGYTFNLASSLPATVVTIRIFSDTGALTSRGFHVVAYA